MLPMVILAFWEKYPSKNENYHLGSMATIFNILDTQKLVPTFFLKVLQKWPLQQFPRFFLGFGKMPKDLKIVSPYLMPQFQHFGYENYHMWVPCCCPLRTCIWLESGFGSCCHPFPISSTTSMAWGQITTIPG